MEDSVLYDVLFHVLVQLCDGFYGFCASLEEHGPSLTMPTAARITTSSVIVGFINLGSLVDQLPSKGSA